MDALTGLLFNLQTISSIPKGKKISTAKEFITLDDDDTTQPWRRWRSGDSRDKAVSTICREIRIAIKISDLLTESEYLYNDSSKFKRNERIDNIKKLCRGLKNSVYGIDNLCDTYIGDANVLAHLKPLNVEISEQVAKLKKKLIELGEYVEDKKIIN